MDRQNIFKVNLRNNNIMDTNNIMERNVEDFFKMLEKENDNKAFYRYINVFIKNGNKIPIGEKNNLTIQGIYNDRGKPHYNTLSLAVKHIPDLYVVDYDTPEVDCDFYRLLNNDGVAFTPTKKGSHYYIKIKNISKYTNQQKIHINSDIDVDLIKKNNIWETRTRTIKGEVKEYDWEDIKQYFNVSKMNFENSPPVTPTTSDDDNNDNDFVEQPLKVYDATEIQTILNMLPQECYEYNCWIKIGMAICNICNADNIGLGMFVEWSKKDEENFDLNVIKSNWKRWKKTKLKVGLTTLRKLKQKYQPQKDKSLEQVFISKLSNVKYGKTISFAKRQMLKEMNERLIFVKETGDYIILDKKIIRKEDETLITMPCWYLKNATKTKDHFVKEKFSFTYINGDPDEEDDDDNDDDDEKVTIHINPFKEWCEWIDRREVRAIGFDPRENSNKDIFNLWNGFNISKEVADAYDEKEAEPILNVIKDIWCKGDMDAYNYVLNYFSHIIQKPHIKTSVLLALKSKQGGMKGIILNKLGNIIGDTHYAQNSNANFLFGDFNGQLEGKILINLDEAFWGGDKKLEGVVKNKITETRQTINKKNKENYNIDCYANYIITTNNDWFAGTTEDDRRHYCLELDNRMAGRMTPEKRAYIQPVLDAPCEAFAKILYNRDISNFKPREFKKTKLLQQQVELNWNSPKVFWNKVMKDGGFEYEGHFIEWGKTLKIPTYEGDKTYGLEIKNKKKEKRVVYSKEWIFKCYDKQNYNGRKFDNSSFWREIEKNEGCLGDLYVENRIQVRKQRKMYVFLPSLEEARNKWNEVQEYDYNYEEQDEDEWEIDDGYSSDE
jgi:hypothetical protein